VRNWQILTVLVCLLVFVGYTAVGSEPSYQSKKLSQWLSLYQKADPNTPDETRARNAVRAIGTNGIPTLVQMLTSTDLEVQDAGHKGFEILGSSAAQAVPALAKLLTGTNKLVRFTAAQALGEIGAPALPVLMAGLTNRSFAIGTDSALAIVNLGTNAAPAIPILLNDLQNPNHFYRERAADALGNLHIQPDVVVPALTNLLNDPTNAARFIAINSLGKFGPAARSAVPVIAPFLTNSDLDVVAKRALRQIAPEVLTNAPRR